MDRVRIDIPKEVRVFLRVFLAVIFVVTFAWFISMYDILTAGPLENIKYSCEEMCESEGYSGKVVLNSVCEGDNLVTGSCSCYYGNSTLPKASVEINLRLSKSACQRCGEIEYDYLHQYLIE